MRRAANKPGDPGNLPGIAQSRGQSPRGTIGISNGRTGSWPALTYDNGGFMRFKIALLATVLMASSPAWAVNHDVTLRGPGSTTFTPNSVDVLVGDTVTFHNNAGGFHNVASTDAAFPFQCSVDCVSNNNGSAANWTAVVTVPDTAAHKDVQFFCQVHGAQLMSGTFHITNPVDLQSFSID